MRSKNQDWKDVANGYKERSYTIAILLILLVLFIAPKIEIEPFQLKSKVEMKVVPTPATDDEIVKLPELVRNDQIIDFEEFDEEDEDEDIIFVDTMPSTKLNSASTFLLSSNIKNRIVDEEAVAVKRIPPVYPKFQLKASLEGTVYLDVEVLFSGEVGRIEILQSGDSSIGGFDDAAIEAVRQWEFQPAKTNGKAVTCWVTFPVAFVIQ